MMSFKQFLRELRFADLHPRAQQWKKIPTTSLDIKCHAWIRNKKLSVFLGNPSSGSDHTRKENIRDGMDFTSVNLVGIDI